MNLLELQRRMAADLMHPLDAADCLDPSITPDYIKPNDRLTSRERLEIYSRSYWYRLLDSLYEDFPGLRAVVGQRAFAKLAEAYLAGKPSESWTLRNLGGRLEEWLCAHAEFAGDRLPLALDMVRLEWAHIEAFDNGGDRVLGPEDLLEVGAEMRLRLQPYIRLLELSYPVDDLRVKVNAASAEHGTASNAVLKRKTGGMVRRIAQLPRQKIFLAVHRLDLTVYYRRLEAEEYGVLSALRDGQTLGEAMESAAQAAPSRVEAWFAAWAQMGWLCRWSA